MCKQVGTGFGNLVRVATFESHVLDVREDCLFSVRFVTGRDQYSLDLVALAAAGLQEVVSAPDVGFECWKRRP